MAPGKAHRDMYVRDGKVDSSLSKTGALAIGVPGSLAAVDWLSRNGGKLSLAYHLEQAAQIAENGHGIDQALSERLERTAADLARFSATKSIFLDADGKPWKRGHRLVQYDLAASYRSIAQDGIEWFYGGEFARRLEEWSKANDGIITQTDFARYELKFRTPIVSRYRDLTVVGFPPPSSGGVHVAQILNMLEARNLLAMKASDRAHVMAESMKLAFADRAHWLGDPDYVDVPRGLTDAGYARSLAARISMDETIKVPRHGTPPRDNSDLFERHTAHFTTADSAGNWVSMTSTLNTTLGSKVVVPGTGVLMNNQMDDFSAQPGVPNTYGLVGSEANSIEPGKRPLSSMSPTILLRDNKPVMTVGAAGGPTIITQVVQTIVNVEDLGMPLQRAVGEPRIHHQWRPDVLRVEKAVSETVRNRLAERGHKLNDSRATYGVTQAILLDGQNFVPVHDPRVAGKAAAWGD
ncbi:MAG: gamma-glutamyltransferase, partial [Planctomycetota bacterium]|jgi:gamma-glutamyltranspeptidase/glutathione hydrolase